MFRSLLAALFLLPGICAAATIDTRPQTSSLSVSKSTTGDIFGGTFLSQGTTLDSFTLSLSAFSSPPETFMSLRAVVMSGVATGLAGSLLWQSDVLNLPTDDTFREYAFAPNLSINLGEQYFIGFDSGTLVSLPAGGSTGSNAIGFSSDSITGQAFGRFNGGGTFTFTDSNRDIASEIVMSTAQVPLPAAAFLLLAGLASFGAVSARRARA
jgi:hypothetical protein